VTGPTRIKPCTEWSETAGWSQTRFLSGEKVKRGTYAARACLRSPVFHSYLSPLPVVFGLQ
jgi:hypothetical protein